MVATVEQTCDCEAIVLKCFLIYFLVLYTRFQVFFVSDIGVHIKLLLFSL